MGNLSEMENGKRPMKESTFRSFVNYYGVDFNFDIDIFIEIYNLLNDLMEAYIYKNLEREKQILDVFMNNKVGYEYSLASLYVPLFIMMSSRTKAPVSLSDIESSAYNEIDEYLSVFDKDEAALIFYLKAFQSKRKMAFDQSLSLYTRALSTFDGERWPQLEGIIKLNYAQTVMYEKSFYEGYQIGQEAHDIFVKHGNYTRALMCYNNIANYLLCLQSFEGAKEYIKKILLSNPSITGVPIYRQAVTTMLITLTLDEEFQQVIQFAADHPFDCSDGYIGNLILIPYCHYRLGHNALCLEQMAKFDPCSLQRDDKAFFAVLKAIIKQDKTKIEASKQQMIKVCCRQRNWSMLMVLYQLLIFYYKSTGEWELLIDAYECNYKVIRHHLPL